MSPELSISPNIIFHDFETYSEAPIKEVGAFEYSDHPSTEIICLSWSINEGPPVLYKHGDPLWHLESLFKQISYGAELHAWNAEFEYLIWNNCCVKKYGWPKTELKQYHDTMAFAMTLGFPANLDKCGEALELDVVKDKRGKYLINKLSKPRRPTKMNPDNRWLPHTAPEDFKDMYDYCRQDVRAERAIHHALPYAKLLGDERDLWLMTVKLNVQGVPIDIETVKNLQYLLSEYEKEQNDRLAILTNNYVTTANQVKKMREWMETFYQVDLPDLTAATVKSALEDSLPEKVKEVLKIRSLLARSSIKKFKRVIKSVDKNGMIHDILLYYGALTGRWGGKNFQLHNLPRAEVSDPDLVADLAADRDLELFKMFYDDPMYVGSAMIRPIIKAKPDHILNVADFSSIENRGNCWLARDAESLRLFQKGVDQYKWFATKLYRGVDYDSVNKDQRFHAKTAILGLGYGMGAERFYETCHSYGLEISHNEAKRTVDLYRVTFNRIVSLWYKLYEAAMKAVVDKRVSEYSFIKFVCRDNFLFMIMPNSRRIAYYKPRVEQVSTPWGDKKKGLTFMGTEFPVRKWKRLHIIPGRLTENAVQGLSRDILAEAKLRVSRKGYNVIFSVHDEIVSHDKKDFGHIDEFCSIMCNTDKSIYPGLPIDAEGFATNRYKK